MLQLWVISWQVVLGTYEASCVVGEICLAKFGALHILDVVSRSQFLTVSRYELLEPPSILQCRNLLVHRRIYIHGQTAYEISVASTRFSIFIQPSPCSVPVASRKLLFFLHKGACFLIWFGGKLGWRLEKEQIVLLEIILSRTRRQYSTGVYSYHLVTECMLTERRYMRDTAGGRTGINGYVRLSWSPLDAHAGRRRSPTASPKQIVSRIMQIVSRIVPIAEDGTAGV